MWRLRGFGSDYLVMRRWDLDPGEKFVEKPSFVSSTLDRLLTDSSMMRGLGELVGGASSFGARELPGQREQLRARLLEAFRSGQLVLVADESGRSGGGGSSSGSDSQAGGGKAGAKGANPESQAPAPGKNAPAPGRGGSGSFSTSTKTWIEFQLLDNNDKPIANERYIAKLTDGSTKTGNLDANGSARFTGLDPGNCDISFPDLDTRDWASA